MQISKAGPIKVAMSQLHVIALCVLHLQSKSLHVSENSKNKDKLLNSAGVWSVYYNCYKSHSN